MRGDQRPGDFIDRLADILLSDAMAARVGHEAGHVLRGVGRFFRRVRGVGLTLESGLQVDLADSQSSTWSSSIESLLDNVRRRGSPVVAILDEFSMMLDNFARKGVDPTIIVNLLAWFRALRQGQGSDTILTFTVGGSMSLEYWLRRLNATALMNDLHREEVPPFDPIVARSFVVALLQSERLDWDANVPDAILARIVPAVPFWIQAIIWLLVQQPARTRRITTNDVEEAYRKRLLGEAGRHFFQPFEERLSRFGPATVHAAQRILTHLARDRFDDRGIARATLATVFAEVTGDQSPEAFDYLLADLQSDFYVRYDEASDRCVFAHRVAHRVLRDWWLRWHPTAGASASGEVVNEHRA